MRLIDADAFDERVRVAGGMSEEELTEDFKDGIQAVLYMLSKQPTINPEPHWIPVTKPPTDRRICYVTLKDTNDENRQNWVAEMIYTPWDGFDLMDGIEAIAWMPKQYPEPYKGVTE